MQLIGQSSDYLPRAPLLAFAPLAANSIFKADKGQDHRNKVTTQMQVSVSMEAFNAGGSGHSANCHCIGCTSLIDNTAQSKCKQPKFNIVNISGAEKMTKTLASVATVIQNY